MAAFALSAYAQKTDSTQQQLVDISELTLDDTLMFPDVPEKQQDYIRAYMKREAQSLVKLGYTVETTRKGEVLIVTIPASDLFAPNDTALLKTADARLRPILPFFQTHGRFKVILAMHSDDTGSPDYLEKLTEDRIVSLYNYFDTYARQTDMLQGYPMADSEPLPNTPNTSIKNRARNRRLEIYIVPGPGLITEAKGKRS